jgi:2-methylisocitrate lyase-like PEP mutase family enzyme
LLPENIPHPPLLRNNQQGCVTNMQQQSKAAALLALHSGGEILLLPNVWDVASARIVEECGFKAIATSSAGVAFSLGYPDGQVIPGEEMLAAIARISKAVSVPVTADVESGYGNTPEDAARTARAVIDAGAVGLNLEDAVGDSSAALVELPLQLEKIHAVREAAGRMRIPLVLNARTDVYLLQIGDPASRYDETVRRLSAFRDAGADCVFAPGVQDAAIIGRLVADLKCPVNILAGEGSPSTRELFNLGVARVSLGSAPMRAALGQLRRIAEELKTTGTYSMLEGAPAHAEINSLLERKRH